MRRIFLPVVILAVMILTSCGSSTSHNTNGQCIGSLVNENQTPENQFRATFAQGTGSTFTVSNFDFLPAAPCFTTMAETATLSGGSFQMTIKTLFPAAENNVLTLQGTPESNGNFSGTRTVTGQTGCTGNGTFTMPPQIPVDPPV